jgi:hypothetical protein
MPFADGPHARELVEAAARGGHARGNGVGVIGDMHRRSDAALLKRRSQLRRQPHAFHLRQIGRLLDHARAHDAGNGYADRVDPSCVARIGLVRRGLFCPARLAFCQAFNLPGQKIDQFAVGNRLERFHCIRVAGIAQHFSRPAADLPACRRDVVCNHDADCRCHNTLLGKSEPRFGS